LEGFFFIIFLASGQMLRSYLNVMENNIQPQVIHFLDQYYNNPQVEGRDFLEAVKEKISEFSDPELQEKFIFCVIEKGRAMRDRLLQHLQENQTYQLRGDEF
jgi:hypothetical protein